MKDRCFRRGFQEKKTWNDSLATRASLLSQLRNWEDQAGWREFFDRYWRRIYNVARKAGLADAEAQDIVQETLLSVARKMPGSHYDPALGSFKSWLLLIVRSRITDPWRRRAVRPPFNAGPEPEEGKARLGRIPATVDGNLEHVWQEGWERTLLVSALERAKSRVVARQFLVFEMAPLQGIPAGTIARTLGIHIAQVYLARHRVGSVQKTEVTRLRREQESGPGTKMDRTGRNERSTLHSGPHADPSHRTWG